MGESLKMFRSFRPFTVLVLLSLTVAGCGGNKAKDGSAFQHDKAQTLFIEAIRARPTDQAKALDLLNQSIDTKPTYNAYFHRAWLYALKNDDAKANEDIKTGLALEPGSTDLQWLDGEMKKPADKRKLDMPPAKSK
jgi:hypothetical protein